ncbi:hypothetical protein [Salinarchaeum laminariae]|uniref:hypothetical protein n=1 Tax=Salinarchaeum laminariae TaxID=869888 RepID=UPI0020BDC0CF|nr:hypothetical protein [Salinarchaeum laminariae]
MSVDPHEAERELRDEPKPTTREEPRGETIVGDPVRDTATDAEVRDAIEGVLKERDRDE